MSTGRGGIITQSGVDDGVSPLSTDEPPSPQHTLADESGPFQRPLLGDVVNLGGRLHAVDRRGGEEVIDEQPLRRRPDTPATELGQEDDADPEAPGGPEVVIGVQLTKPANEARSETATTRTEPSGPR